MESRPGRGDRILWAALIAGVLGICLLVAGLVQRSVLDDREHALSLAQECEAGGNDEGYCTSAQLVRYREGDDPPQVWFDESKPATYEVVAQAGYASVPELERGVADLHRVSVSLIIAGSVALLLGAVGGVVGLRRPP